MILVCTSESSPAEIFAVAVPSSAWAVRSAGRWQISQVDTPKVRDSLMVAWKWRAPWRTAAHASSSDQELAAIKHEKLQVKDEIAKLEAKLKS